MRKYGFVVDFGIVYFDVPSKIHILQCMNRIDAICVSEIRSSQFHFTLLQFCVKSITRAEQSHNLFEIKKWVVQSKQNGVFTHTFNADFNEENSNELTFFHRNHKAKQIEW